MTFSASQKQEFTSDRAFRRWGVLESQGVLAGTANRQHKRPTLQPWMLVTVLLACVHLLGGVQCAEQARVSKNSQAVQVKLDLEEGRIYLDITRCISQDPNANTNTNTKASECVGELCALFRLLSKERQSHPCAYRVSIGNEVLECLTGCCEELAVHLARQVSGIEGLRVAELRVESRSAASKPMDRVPVFTESPGRLLVVQSLRVCNVSSVCFHSLCSVVQVCSSDATVQPAVLISGVPHINLTKHPLAYPWAVSRIVIDRAKTVDLGASVHRLPSECQVEGVEGFAAPGLWVRDKVVVFGGNCCMGNSVVALVNAGVSLKGSVKFLGIAVPESTPETELPEAVYRAVCAVRKAEVGQDAQRYLVVGHKGYQEQDPDALRVLRQGLNACVRSDPKQQTDVPLSQVVKLRSAPEGGPFMYVDIGEGEETGGEAGIPWAVRVEQEVLASAAGCVEAAAQLAQHSANVHVLEAVAVLRSVEEALSDPSLPGAGIITGTHGMTLLPCGCFEEDVLSKAWHGKAQACRSKQCMEYRHFPRITLSRQADGRVHVEIPGVVALFGAPVVGCDPVYQVRKVGEHSAEIRVSRAAKRECGGVTRRQYITQITQLPARLRDVIRGRAGGGKALSYFKKITFTTTEAISPGRWVYVWMQMADALARNNVVASTVEIGGGEKGAEKRSTVWQKAVVGHLLTEKAREWCARGAGPLEIGMLRVEQQVVEHLPVLSRVVQTENLAVTMGSGEGVWVYISEESGVRGQGAQDGPRSAVPGAWIYSPGITEHLGRCQWRLNELYVYGKQRVCTGAAPKELGPRVTRGGQMCESVVAEGEVVFEGLGAVRAYCQWKKAMSMEMEEVVKRYRGMEIFMRQPKTVWIDDRTFDRAGDCRPQIQKYLEALMAWYPAGVHVVFQVRVSTDTEYDLTRAYEFYPQSHQAQWKQAKPGSWQIELEVCECAGKTERVVSTAWHRIYLAQATPEQPEYRWVHVPGWAISTAELKEKSVGVLEKLFGTVYFGDSYYGNSGRYSGSTSNPVTGDGAKDCCAICLGEFNFVPTAEDLIKAPTLKDPGVEITVLRCGHVYHRVCFEVQLDTVVDPDNPSDAKRCAMCNRAIKTDGEAGIPGRVDTLSGKKEPSGEDTLEVVPEHSGSIYERVVTWTVADSPREEVPEEPRKRKRRRKE